jgi:TorA maturation chaperone TorD
MNSIYTLDKLNQTALLERGWSTDDAALMDEAVSFSAETMLPWVIKFQQRLVAVETECRFYQLITAILCAILRFIGNNKS